MNKIRFVSFDHLDDFLFIIYKLINLILSKRDKHFCLLLIKIKVEFCQGYHKEIHMANLMNLNDVEHFMDFV